MAKGIPSLKHTVIAWIAAPPITGTFLHEIETVPVSGPLSLICGAAAVYGRPVLIKPAATTISNRSFFEVLAKKSCWIV